MIPANLNDRLFEIGSPFYLIYNIRDNRFEMLNWSKRQCRIFLDFPTAVLYCGSVPVDWNMPGRKHHLQISVYVDHIFCRCFYLLNSICLFIQNKEGMFRHWASILLLLRCIMVEWNAQLNRRTSAAYFEIFLFFEVLFETPNQFCMIMSF